MFQINYTYLNRYFTLIIIIVILMSWMSLELSLSNENLTVENNNIIYICLVSVLWIRTSWARNFTPSMCDKLLQPSDKQRHGNIRKNTEVT